MIIERLTPSPYASNCYIVADEESKEALIIDPGDGAAQILDRIHNLTLKVKLIVLTHHHPDHIGALKEVKNETGADLAIHTDDALGLQKGSFFGSSPKEPPPNPERLLSDGDSIDIGNLSLTVIHTPGHTTGGICLLVEGVLLSGDTLFNFGIGRYDLPGGDGNRLMESIMNRLMVLPDETIVYPGHGPESTIGTERRGNPFLSGNPFLNI